MSTMMTKALELYTSSPLTDADLFMREAMERVPFWLKVVHLYVQWEDDNGGMEGVECWRVVATKVGTTEQLVHWHEFASRKEATEFMRKVAHAKCKLGWHSLDERFWASREDVRRAGWVKVP